MRIVLIGAVDSTAAALRTLMREGVPPVAVVTLPLSHAARHSDFCDLRPFADQAGSILVDQMDFSAEIASLRPDYVFVIGWSRIVPADVFKHAVHGAVGYHPAPLPENRGRAVIPWTILQRKRSTGGTLFWIDERIDTGDILEQTTFAVADDETATTLYGKHLESLELMLKSVVERFRRGDHASAPQDHSRATYCARRTANDGWIEWALPAEQIWTQIRASTHPYPGAFTVRQRERIVIWSADLIGPGPYWGTPGQVQDVSAAGAIVTCGDGQHILVRLVECANGGPVGPDGVLKRHEKLGFTAYEIWQSTVNLL